MRRCYQRRRITGKGQRRDCRIVQLDCLHQRPWCLRQPNANITIVMGWEKLQFSTSTPFQVICFAPEGPWSQATVLLPPAGLACQTAITAGFDPSFSEALAKRRPEDPSSKGHHFSTFTRPPCSKVFLGEVTVSGLRCARSASQNFTWPSAEPLISNGGTAVTSKVKTAPVWPANVYKAFSNFCSKDQQIKYPSLEHVKRYLPSAETQTFRIGLSCRHMKLGARLSSSCFFSRLCLRSNSCFRLFSMPCTAAAGRSAVMSWVFSKTSESPGSLPAKRVTSFKSKSFELILSCWFCARFSPVFTFSSNFKISRNFFANFKNSFSSSANADCFWYVDSARQLIGGPLQSEGLNSKTLHGDAQWSGWERPLSNAVYRIWNCVFSRFQKNAKLNIEVWNPKTFQLFQDVKFYIKLRPQFQGNPELSDPNDICIPVQHATELVGTQ